MITMHSRHSVPTLQSGRSWDCASPFWLQHWVSVKIVKIQSFDGTIVKGQKWWLAQLSWEEPPHTSLRYRTDLDRLVSVRAAGFTIKSIAIFSMVLSKQKNEQIEPAKTQTAEPLTIPSLSRQTTLPVASRQSCSVCFAPSCQ